MYMIRCEKCRTIIKGDICHICGWDNHNKEYRR